MLTVVQVLPALEVGGVERGTLEVAAALTARGHRSIVVSAGGRLVEQLNATGSEHVRLAIGRKSPTTLRHIKTLRRLLRATGADILHARSRVPAWIGYWAWRGMDPLRPRFVTTMHGPNSVNRYSRIMTRGERVIAVSEYLRGYILTNYPDVDPGKVVTIPRGVDRAAFPYGYRPVPAWLSDWQRQHPELAGRFLVTLPGRITRRKGLADFITIMADLVRRDLPAHGLVAGGAVRRHAGFLREIQGRIHAAGLTDRITLLGHRDDLREVMSVSDAVLILSRQPESFGRTALEALCLGTPVIAYDRGGSTEILQTLFPRGLVPPDDTGQAAQRIAEFIEQRPAVPENNSAFTLHEMLERTLRLYEELAGARGG